MGAWTAAAAVVFAVPLVAAPAAGAAPRANVLVVGDSLEELTGPHISQFLPGVKVTVDAVGGANTFKIRELFEESYEPSQSVVVFDGGTNDNPNYPQILEENLAKVAAAVGDRCMVVPTIHGFTVEGTGNRGKNAVVHRFAASRPGTQTPDWASFVHHHPQLMADELHPDATGAERRAELIAEGILGCIAFEETDRRRDRRGRVRVRGAGRSEDGAAGAGRPPRPPRTPALAPARRRSHPGGDGAGDAALDPPRRLSRPPRSAPDGPVTLPSP